ncbi:hypothetical protein [Azospirillum sp.]|uniref:hypothetical protein n=1 Tax=Azospirillum sp. TaxID=34012 RepID=UPI003D71343D
MVRDNAALMRFYVDHTDRFGERQVDVVLAPCLELAERSAGRLPGMVRSRDMSVDPIWDVVHLPDGETVFRWDWERRMAGHDTPAIFAMAAE